MAVYEIVFLIWCVIILYLVTSFIRNRLIGYLWVIIGIIWVSYGMNMEKFLSWEILGVFFLLIGLSILIKQFKITYILWSVGILTVGIRLTVGIGFKGIPFLIIGLLWSAYRRKSFLRSTE